LQREDLNPLEEAQAFSNLIDKFGLTHQEVGEVVSRSRAAVSRSLLALDVNQQAKCAQTMVQRQLSVRAAEALVKDILAGGSKKKSAKTNNQDPDVNRMEHKLSDRLGAHVSIQHSQNGSGRMQIRYTNLDEFEGIVDKLLGKSK